MCCVRCVVCPVVIFFLQAEDVIRDVAVTGVQTCALPISGGAPSRIKGEEEYYGVREYRIGDNPRRIHWRRTAQTGQLMVRDMAKTRDLRFWGLLDSAI